jgi:hypothetical protein
MGRCTLASRPGLAVHVFDPALQKRDKRGHDDWTSSRSIPARSQECGVRAPGAVTRRHGTLRGNLDEKASGSSPISFLRNASIGYCKFSARASWQPGNRQRCSGCCWRRCFGRPPSGRFVDCCSMNRRGRHGDCNRRRSRPIHSKGRHRNWDDSSPPTTPRRCRPCHEGRSGSGGMIPPAPSVGYPIGCRSRYNWRCRRRYRPPRGKPSVSRHASHTRIRPRLAGDLGKPRHVALGVVPAHIHHRLPFPPEAVIADTRIATAVRDTRVPFVECELELCNC